MTTHILDASAILALLYQEPGWKKVKEVLLAEKHAMSSVNYAEVVSKSRDGGIPMPALQEILAQLNLSILPFDQAQATIVGDLRPPTRGLGLSLGDRACLALAITLGATAVTADRAWLSLPPDLSVPILYLRDR